MITNRESRTYPVLDGLVDRLEMACTKEERRTLGALVASAMRAAGCQEHRGWCLTDLMLVEAHAGREDEAAAWLAEHDIDVDPRERKGQSRRVLGSALRRAGLEACDVPSELFDVTVRWSVRSRRMSVKGRSGRRVIECWTGDRWTSPVADARSTA